MKKNGRLGLFALIWAVVFLIGLAQLGHAEAKPLTFGVSIPLLSHEPWASIYFGIQDECKKFDRDVKLVVLNAGGLDRLNHQIKQVENLIQRGVDAILIGATSTKGIVPMVEEAKKNGIPILGVERLPETEILTRVRVDDYGMGRIQATFLGKHLSGRGKVAMMSGPTGQSWAVDRAAGFRATLRSAFARMEVVSEAWMPLSRHEALNLMADWIQRFPDLQGIYTADDPLAVGAVEAITAAGKADRIKVSSSNPTHSGMRYLKEGGIVGFAVQQAVVQGRIAARCTFNFLIRGEVISEVLTAGLPLSLENADTFNFTNVFHPKNRE